MAFTCVNILDLKRDLLGPDPSGPLRDHHFTSWDTILTLKRILFWDILYLSSFTHV